MPDNTKGLSLRIGARDESFVIDLFSLCQRAADPHRARGAAESPDAAAEEDRDVSRPFTNK